ncbi:dienelactone hydrolase family protein [Nitrospirillum viridazoti]|uniref:Dienelactone hydrolase domain-containing protein n=2 Tax=Nitrospirillum TaxID=1543705 RepID=A0A248K0Y8_9PROT|nr:dienelactone hydrolase family protein [Nitrospirillum amazonense]ASG24480.1 hypothetical protein Y958_26780 [Nitrospirillum amazonense CBAmc]TWB37176.1 putative alpha/beta-hydrolase family hydrolase [Nitrospirillum amazonense]TWB47685.1 putative alpha/beta-hydrolase family hydrolase [Nitrospirillum amazonense]
MTHLPSGADLMVQSHVVRVPPLDGEAMLRIPDYPHGVVLFAHGSGSSRHSPRNGFVASELNRAGIATLLFDLLSEEEEGDRRRVFDIGLLARRLTITTDWIAAQEVTRGLPIGYFGASTGAAAALVAAAGLADTIAAVVSRGGRPDLAGTALPAVAAPTLLIVGGADAEVLDLNRSAARHLRCPHRVEVIPDATHLFEEPGALETVAVLAQRWFLNAFAPGHDFVMP